MKIEALFGKLRLRLDEVASGKTRRVSLLCKGLMMVALSAFTAWGAWGVERLSVDEVVSHYPWNGKVDCVCTLSGLNKGKSYKGAFTLAVKKGGETIRRTVTNDFGTVDGTYTNTFDCSELFDAAVYLNGGIAVDLIRHESDYQGVPIGVMGDVLVIDVSAGSAATYYPTEEISGIDLGLFNCNVYKTDKIVLRKVSAGTYYCQPGADSSTTVSQKLTTKGFYIGVFSVTQRQYELVMGTNPSHFKTDFVGNKAAQRPVEQVSWNTIRGNTAAGTAISVSSADSFLKRLVERTGLSGFDLPTEAQWEIACRANATAAYGAYWNGTAAVALTLETIGEVAWYKDNASSVTHAVGGKSPNLWGLYDMLGNELEWCRDMYTATFNTGCVDVPYSVLPEGFFTCVVRGGSWEIGGENCSPSGRGDGYANRSDYVQGFYGFRLSKALP